MITPRNHVAQHGQHNECLETLQVIFFQLFLTAVSSGKELLWNPYILDHTLRNVFVPFLLIFSKEIFHW